MVGPKIGLTIFVNLEIAEPVISPQQAGLNIIFALSAVQKLTVLKRKHDHVHSTPHCG